MKTFKNTVQEGYGDLKTEGWNKLQDEELYDLHSLPDVVRSSRENSTWKT
jgi:hypothetical protein